MRKQIKRYIRERRKEGFSDDMIREKFIDSGYDPSVVDACLKECAGGETARPKPLPAWIGWFILSLLLATIVLLFRQSGLI